MFGICNCLNLVNISEGFMFFENARYQFLFYRLD